MNAPGTSAAPPGAAVFPHVEGVTHRFVEARGIRFHVAEAGDGPPLVLVHGWPQHWYMWRYQIPALAARFRVVCIDLRGFGWSDAPPGAYLKEDLADDVIAVIEALGYDRARLAGHDWGGWTSFLVCLKRPDLIERFVALNIPHPFLRWNAHPSGIVSMWYQVLLATPVVGPFAVQSRQGFIPLSFGTSMRHRKLSADDVEIYARPLREPARARATMRLYRSFIFGELWRTLAGKYHGQRLSVPTLILFGKDDVALSPRLLAGLDDHADDATVELIDRAGHFVAEEQPEIVAERMLAFLGA